MIIECPLENEEYHMEQIQGIMDLWNDTFNMPLEQKPISGKLIQKDVNNYIHEDDSTGAYFKNDRKGDVINTLRVVEEAVINHLVNDGSIEDYIMDAYLNKEFIKFQQITKNTRLYEGYYYGDEKLDLKVLRLFYTLNGKLIQKIPKDKKSPLSKVTFASKSSSIMNLDVNEETMREVWQDLDLQYYVDLAKDIVKKFV